MRKFAFLLALLFSVASAHVEEGIEPPEFVSIIWAIHSWTHWLVWLGFLYTCYYFRFVIGRLLGHPSDCMVAESGRGYDQESGLKHWHGIFVWIMLIWTVIHISELIGAWLGYSELPVYSLGEFIPGDEIWEWFYIAATVLFLSSCHYTRFLTGSGTKCFSCLAFGKYRQEVFTFQGFLNAYHGLFFWVAIASSILLLLAGGHL